MDRVPVEPAPAALRRVGRIVRALYPVLVSVAVLHLGVSPECQREVVAAAATGLFGSN